MKFVLLVEGRTERDSVAAFLKRWLDPLLNQPIGIQVVAFDGYADLVGKMAIKAKMHLQGRKRAEIVGWWDSSICTAPRFIRTTRRPRMSGRNGGNRISSGR